MKKTWVLLPMIFGAVLVHGANCSESNQAQEIKSSPQSSEKSANNRDPKDLKKSTSVAASAAKRRTAAGQAKPAPRRALRSSKPQAANDLPNESPRNVPGFYQPSSTMSSDASGKRVKHSSTPAAKPILALNGQQFKNGRDPGAHIAGSEIAAKPNRGTAAINGSEMKRRP
jgi:hypothetical protein